MTQVSNDTYNPIVTLALDDGLMPVDVLAAVTSLAGSCTAHDLAVLNEIVGQCGRTRRGAALARAYLGWRE